MFGKLKLPVFDCARRNYLTFKLEWEETAGCSGYSLELEVRELRKKLPKEVQAEVKVMRTTAQIWTFLDQEYGSKLELTSTLVSTLENFQISKAARTESERFLELYRAWTSVYNNLLYSGEAAVLNHGPMLDKIAKKLPSQEGKSRWINIASQ